MKAGDIIAFSTDAVVGNLILDGSHLSSGEYSLNIRRVDNAGESLFNHTSISISDSDTHIFNYAEWNGIGSIVLEIDSDSNGSIDETLYLENQLPLVFLPLIYR